MPMLFGFILLSFLSVLPPQAAAQANADPIGCDETVLFECGQLAYKYRTPGGLLPVFPNDPARADALVKSAIDGAIVGCSGANYDLCYTLSDMLMQLEAPPTEMKYTNQGRLEAYLTGTEAGCDAGIPAACYWRSVAFMPHLLEFYDLGIARKMASGLSRDEARNALAEDQRTYKNRARDAARAQLPALRQACVEPASDACVALARLLGSFDIKDTPFEHVFAMIRSCSTERPRLCGSLQNTVNGLAYSPRDKDVATRAIALLSQGCAAGNGAHCTILGAVGADGAFGLDGASMTQQACDLKFAGSCHSIATVSLIRFERSKAPDDLTAASDMLTRACDLGHNLSCHMIEHLSKG